MLDLAPDANISALGVQDLSVLDAAGRLPPITGTRLEQIDGRVVVRVSVPQDQPAGTYFGSIVDRTNLEPRGTLRIIVRS
jgi:hypothetical protein